MYQRNKVFSGLFPTNLNLIYFVLDDNLIIPAGSGVMIAVFDAHRDPDQWQHPWEFYPDHFLPENVAKRHPFAFVPFSYGPRSCIG